MIPTWERCGTWPLRGEPDACRRLGQRDLGQMRVQVVQLCLAVQAKNNEVSALASLGDGGMELGCFCKLASHGPLFHSGYDPMCLKKSLVRLTRP
jgi:hypothetical protein